MFHAKASHAVGMGHLMRCRALAEEFVGRDMPCAMMGPDRAFMSDTDMNLYTQWQQSRACENDDEIALEIIAAMHNFNAHYLVVDDPAGKSGYQDTLASHGVKWLQFDGRCDPNLRARWIVNQQPQISFGAYAGSYNAAFQRILCGPRYAPIRRTFQRQCPPRPELKKIVAIFGGGDDRGMHELTVRAFGAALGQYDVTLVCGEANPRNGRIERLVENVGNIDLVVEPAELPALLCSADLVLTAGGTTTYELAALGLPMLITAVVDNQVAQSAAWAEMGAAVYLGESHEIDASTLTEAVDLLARSPTDRMNLGYRAREICDGQGAQRIADHMLRGDDDRQERLAGMM